MPRALPILCLITCAIRGACKALPVLAGQKYSAAVVMTGRAACCFEYVSGAADTSTRGPFFDRTELAANCTATPPCDTGDYKSEAHRLLSLFTIRSVLSKTLLMTWASLVWQ